jgi:hypothetical protein
VREGLSLKRMHNLVREIRAQRMLQPPAEFLALQVSRLNEALVSYSAMHSSVAGANFEAVDRVVRIVREFDRYHGFTAVPRPREALETRRLPPPAESPLALEGPRPSDSGMAPPASLLPPGEGGPKGRMRARLCGKQRTERKSRTPTLLVRLVWSRGAQVRG